MYVTFDSDLLTKVTVSALCKSDSQCIQRQLRCEKIKDIKLFWKRNLASNNFKICTFFSFFAFFDRLQISHSELSKSNR